MADCKTACNSSCFPEFMSSALWLFQSVGGKLFPHPVFDFFFLWPIEYTKVTFGSFLTLDFKRLWLLLLFLGTSAYTMIKSLTGMLDNERHVAQSLPSPYLTTRHVRGPPSLASSQLTHQVIKDAWGSLAEMSKTWWRSTRLSSWHENPWEIIKA